MEVNYQQLKGQLRFSSLMLTLVFVLSCVLPGTALAFPPPSPTPAPTPTPCNNKDLCGHYDRALEYIAELTSKMDDIIQQDDYYMDVVDLQADSIRDGVKELYLDESELEVADELEDLADQVRDLNEADENLIDRMIDLEYEFIIAQAVLCMSPELEGGELKDAHREFNDLVKQFNQLVQERNNSVNKRNDLNKQIEDLRNPPPS